MCSCFAFCDISRYCLSVAGFVNSVELQNGDILTLLDLLHLLIRILYKETLSFIYYLVGTTLWLFFGTVRKYIFFFFFSVRKYNA